MPPLKDTALRDAQEKIELLARRHGEDASVLEPQNWMETFGNNELAERAKVNISDVLQSGENLTRHVAVDILQRYGDEKELNLHISPTYKILSFDCVEDDHDIVSIEDTAQLDWVKPKTIAKAIPNIDDLQEVMNLHLSPSDLRYLVPLGLENGNLVHITHPTQFWENTQREEVWKNGLIYCPDCNTPAGRIRHEMNLIVAYNGLPTASELLVDASSDERRDYRDAIARITTDPRMLSLIRTHLDSGAFTLDEVLDQELPKGVVESVAKRLKHPSLSVEYGVKLFSLMDKLFDRSFIEEESEPITDILRMKIVTEDVEEMKEFIKSLYYMQVRDVDSKKKDNGYESTHILTNLTAKFPAPADRDYVKTWRRVIGQEALMEIQLQTPYQVLMAELDQYQTNHRARADKRRDLYFREHPELITKHAIYRGVGRCSVMDGREIKLGKRKISEKKS